MANSNSGSPSTPSSPRVLCSSFSRIEDVERPPPEFILAVRDLIYASQSNATPSSEMEEKILTVYALYNETYNTELQSPPPSPKNDKKVFLEPSPSHVANSPKDVGDAKPSSSIKIAAMETSSPRRSDLQSSPFSAGSWARDSERVDIIDVKNEAFPQLALTTANDHEVNNQSVSLLCSGEAVCVAGVEPGSCINSSPQDAPLYPPAHKVFDQMSTRGLSCISPSSEFRNVTTMEAENLPPSSWSSIVCNRSTLTYVPPLRQGDKLQLPKGLAQLGVEKWKHSLVGFFLDKQLPFSIVKDQANRLWRKCGLTETLSSQKGIFIFKFENAIGCQKVLAKGPWSMLGKPLKLQMWSKDIDINKHNFKTMAIWTNLYNIPLVYWTVEGLSAIASWLGKPLHLDDLTTTCQRISYARICIEISTESEFPSSFMVESESNETFEVKVEYSWIPRKCEVCNAFGHTKTSCNNSVAKEWRPKPTCDINKGLLSATGAVTCHQTNEVKKQDDDWKTVPTKQCKRPSQANPNLANEETSNLVVMNNFDVLNPAQEDTGPAYAGSDCHGNVVMDRVLADISNESPSSASPSSTTLSKKIILVDEVEARLKKKKVKNRK